MPVPKVGNGMSIAEDESHFAMWCVLAAPLIVGCDLTTMSADTRRILTAAGPIAIDQDPLGVQGTVCWEAPGSALQVYRRPLHDGSVAVVAINRKVSGPAANITIDMGRCGHGGGGPTTVSDVWTGKTLSTTTGSSYTVTNVSLHGHSFLRLAKATAERRYMRTSSAVERVALACPPGMHIAGVIAGDVTGECSAENVSLADAAAVMTAVVSGRCSGKQSCSLVASEEMFGSHSGSREWRLCVGYNCVSS